MNGAIANSFLLWTDIQRKQHPKNVWIAQAEKNFVEEEVCKAKELLWQTIGETVLGKMVKRKGASKRHSDIEDISDALQKLSEGKVMPMFIGTSSMVSTTPLYDTSSVECTCGIDKLDGIEKNFNLPCEYCESKQ